MTLEGESLPQWHTYREEMLRDPSLSELRWYICQDAWLDDRFCFVHLKEGCSSCWTSDRPTQQQWQREVTERPLDVAQSGWIAKYNRTLFDIEQSSNRGASHHRSARRGHHPSAPGRARGFRSRSRSPIRRHSRSRSHLHRADPRSRSPLRALPHSHEQHLGHREGGRGASPRCHLPEGSQANARDIVAPAAPCGRWNCDHEHDYAYCGNLGAPQYGPQSNGHYQPRQSPVEDRHVGTVGPTAQDDVDVAVNRALDAQLGDERAEEVAWRAERTTEQLRQSNRELLARLRALETRVL
ncbi:hypothetical protein PHMEG_0009879 [Phytophthora megakarya]|uniref:Uncharacterized protein n=1 Tax=Phytophthora megakarya TaxID=4795 RepID=A0A225WHI6_9STRA|nr:hypothetical protein PHMEG_0009879 [Phytophthora megakarya]